MTFAPTGLEYSGKGLETMWRASRPGTPVTGTPEVPPRQVIIPSRGWEPFEETGIPEIVAEMFPPEPHTESFRFPDGSPDTDRFDDAHEQWRDECLSLAIQASRLPDTLTKLERAERVRDGLIDLVEREQLPVEPVKEDYLVTIAPAYEGEFEDMRFAWDHGAWHTEFTALAKRREHALHGLLAEGGPRTMILPERFHREWLPADLIVIQTLRTLVEREKTGQGVSLLDRRQREQLEAMLFAADPDVRIIDPADPDRGELYAGRASEAHDWVPPGVYDAVGLEGTGEFRVVVGRMPVGDGMTASAAFSPVEHDSAVLNEIARILEHNTEHHAPDEVLRQVNVAGSHDGADRCRTRTFEWRVARATDDAAGARGAAQRVPRRSRTAPRPRSRRSRTPLTRHRNRPGPLAELWLLAVEVGVRSV